MLNIPELMQVPVLAYKENSTSLQPHSIYESIICNEFLEVCNII